MCLSVQTSAVAAGAHTAASRAAVRHVPCYCGQRGASADGYDI